MFMMFQVLQEIVETRQPIDQQPEKVKQTIIIVQDPQEATISLAGLVLELTTDLKEVLILQTLITQEAGVVLQVAAAEVALQGVVVVVPAQADRLQAEAVQKVAADHPVQDQVVQEGQDKIRFVL